MLKLDGDEQEDQENGDLRVIKIFYSRTNDPERAHYTAETHNNFINKVNFQYWNPVLRITTKKLINL